MTTEFSIQQVGRTVQKERGWVKSLYPMAEQKQRNKTELVIKDLTKELKTAGGFRTTNFTKFSIIYCKKDTLKIPTLIDSHGSYITVPTTHSPSLQDNYAFSPIATGLVEPPYGLNTLGHRVNLAMWLVSANGNANATSK